MPFGPIPCSTEDGQEGRSNGSRHHQTSQPCQLCDVKNRTEGGIARSGYHEFLDANDVR